MIVHKNTPNKIYLNLEQELSSHLKFISCSNAIKNDKNILSIIPIITGLTH